MRKSKRLSRLDMIRIELCDIFVLESDLVFHLINGELGDSGSGLNTNILTRIYRFAFLSNNFNYSSKILSILTKVVVQQTFFTPVFNTYFFSVHSLLAGATLDETWERLKKALPVSIQNSVKLWPAVTAFSFMYVPAQFRNVFSGCIAVGWQTYLSWLNQKAAKEVLIAEQLAEAEERNRNTLPAVSGGRLITATAA